MQTRGVLTLGIGALFALFYFGAAWMRPVGLGRSLGTGLDEMIPFVPAAVFVYGWVYTGAFLPLFTVASDLLFARVVRGYGLVIVLATACFVLFPVSAETLRASTSEIDGPGFTLFCVRLLYQFDPPVNLFPSIHVALAVLAAGASWRAEPRLGYFVLPWVLAIALSTLMTKQHFVMDVVAGTLLGVAADRLCVGQDSLPYRSESFRNDRAESRRTGAIMGWLGLHLALVVGAFLLYRSKLLDV